MVDISLRGVDGSQPAEAFLAGYVRPEGQALQTSAVSRGLCCPDATTVPLMQFRATLHAVGARCASCLLLGGNGGVAARQQRIGAQTAFAKSSVQGLSSSNNTLVFAGSDRSERG